MTSRDDRSRLRAERFVARARSYLDDAESLFEKGRPDSAGCLLYESAKQCINAIANQDGLNPGSMQAKVSYLKRREGQSSGSLMPGWQAAVRLHIHADREHLTDYQFRRAWRATRRFIDAMLAIYAKGTHDDHSVRVETE